MCRLLFLLGSKNKKELVENFLSKSVGEVESKTEEFKATVMEEDNYLDGFGFVWLNNNTKKEDGRVWDIYKNEKSYDKVNKEETEIIDDILNELDTKEVVVGHIRRKKIGGKSYENTQPFIFENQIFCHNGLIKSFSSKKKNIKKKIRERISQNFLKEIKGKTDSEYLFFLFLTFVEEIESLKDKNPKTKMHEVLIEAIKEMIVFLESLNVLIYLNMIYCNNEFALITRYVINKQNDTQEAPTLFYNKNDGFIISSDENGDKNETIKENSFIIIKI